MPRVKKKKSSRAKSRKNVKETPAWFGFGARLALLMLVTIAIIVLTAALWHSQWAHRQVHSVENAILHATQKTGFAVKDVMVEGRYYTDKKDILKALNVTAGSPIFTFDPDQAYKKIMAMPWTESVSILRSLPDKIIVRLRERQPMARWQHEGQIAVIDRHGQILEKASARHFPNLPLVVGSSAPEQTRTLLTLLQSFPVVTQVLKAASRVGKRRWNLYLEPNLLIRLPEEDLSKALAKLTDLIRNQKITERDIIAVDLRLPDRIVIEPGPQPKDMNFEDKR